MLKIDYKFKNEALLQNALTHKSYCAMHNGAVNNERLEFLGDSILGFTVAEYLYKNYPELPEGELSKIRAAVVCEDSLYKAAKRIGLGESILLGKGEEMTDGRNRPSILSDATEALLAAIFLDSGTDTVKKIILGLLEEDIKEAVDEKDVSDYKTVLQELTQKEYEEAPEYQLIGEQGPDHNKKFIVALYLQGKLISKGEGKTKKAAEKQAAKIAFGKIKK